MIPLPPRRVHLLLALAVAGACAPGTGGGPIPMGEPSGDDRPAGAVQIITGEQLSGASATLLDALRGRVGNMRVDRVAGSCPRVTFRGARTVLGASDPLVYVDGAPLGDTCGLDQLRTADVRQVEIYPGGSTSRPGYRSSPHGLILVFRVREAGA
jgi:hypothetical protein